MAEQMTSETLRSYDPATDESTAAEPPFPTSNQHVFGGERCIYCNVNTYDIGIYPDALEACIDHEPMVYTTESSGYSGAQS